MRSILLILCLCITGCAARDESFYLRRGREIQSQLIAELEGVESLHELFGKQEALTSLFDELARVGVEARRYQLRTQKSWEVPEESEKGSRELERQMERVLQIPGARAFLERCQSRGFERIDAFENLTHGRSGADERAPGTFGGSARPHIPEQS